MDWTPPEYDISLPPSLKASLEPVPDPDYPENFARTARWSPDGSVFLAHCENRTLQLFPDPSQYSLGEPHVFAQSAAVLNFAWYPTASSLDPSSFCFVASVRESPVQLLDASDGRLRASYKIVDHRERQIAPHSLAFNLSAERLYCGFEDAIEVFDVGRPGEGTRLHTSPSKKSKDGLKGIVSALAFSPFYGSDTAYAAGSLTPSESNIAIYTESQGNVPISFVGGGPRASVMQIQFNPMKPHIMYASYRRRNSIYSWDLRSNVDTPLNIYKCSTHPTTNQRITFDVDISGNRLGTGDQKGSVSIFDLESHVHPEPSQSEEAQTRSADTEFQAHKDSVGSVSFHPLKAHVLSVSGSRHFNTSESSDEALDTPLDVTDDLSINSSVSKSYVTQSKRKLQPSTFDSSIKIWDFQKAL